MEAFRIVCLSLSLIVALSGSTIADDDVVPDSATAVKFDFAKWCKVDDHTFILEKTTLADVARTLKGGVIQRIGNRDDANLEWVVDYTDGRRLIRFSSFGDMGGENHELEGVEIRSLSTGNSGAQLTALAFCLRFQFGTIDMAFPDLVNALGPAIKTHGIAWYKYSGKTMIKVSSGKLLDYDVLATLRVKIEDGKIDSLQLTRVSSS